MDDIGLWVLLISCYQIEIFFRVNGYSCSLLTLRMTLS